MAGIEMKVRRMKTGETLVAQLESFEDAATWLGERPEFTEVLGVLSQDLTSEQHQELKAALRPYSADEQRMIDDADREAAIAIKARLERDATEAKETKRAHAEAQLKADPRRPMSVRWELEGGLSVSDSYDPREVNDVMRAAVDAWIAERNTWVVDRGLRVVEATLTVYPGPVPSGDEADRIVPGGQFVPGPA